MVWQWRLFARCLWTEFSNNTESSIGATLSALVSVSSLDARGPVSVCVLLRERRLRIVNVSVYGWMGACDQSGWESKRKRLCRRIAHYVTRLRIERLRIYVCDWRCWRCFYFVSRTGSKCSQFSFPAFIPHTHTRLEPHGWCLVLADAATMRVAIATLQFWIAVNNRRWRADGIVASKNDSRRCRSREVIWNFLWIILATNILPTTAGCVRFPNGWKKFMKKTKTKSNRRK